MPANRQIQLALPLAHFSVCGLISVKSMLYSLRAAGGKANVDGAKKTRTRDRPKAVPAPEANAELQVNIDVC